MQPRPRLAFCLRKRAAILEVDEQASLWLSARNLLFIDNLPAWRRTALIVGCANLPATKPQLAWRAPR